MTLSPLTIQQIEEQLGKPIRYSSDFEHLSFDIENKTSKRVSPNTLKRLFGAIESIDEPRMYTLDIIASYLGYTHWSDYEETISQEGNSEFTPCDSCNEIISAKLECGDVVAFTYAPNRAVTMRYEGDKHYTVIKSCNSKLEVDDVVLIDCLYLNFPLIVNNVCRKGVDKGDFRAGKISGLTSLKLTKNVLYLE